MQRANQETGGSVLELGEAEYMVRASGYLQSLDDFRKIPAHHERRRRGGAAGRCRPRADRTGDAPRHRRAQWRRGSRRRHHHHAFRQERARNHRRREGEARSSSRRACRAGVEIVPTYDRSSLIKRAVDNLQGKLIEEFIVVALVCVAFLFHLRSAFVAIVSLPLGVLMAFIVMHYQGVNANIMSLGGIAIAIGAMVDARGRDDRERAQAHRSLAPRASWRAASRVHEQWRVIGDAAAQVGPALFFSLLIITLSFVPVFTLEAQEGRLFSPLAFTKTYAMAAAAGLAVTLIPVLMGYLIRGRIPDEQRNPINRGLIALYQPLLGRVLAFPRATLVRRAARPARDGLSDHCASAANSCRRSMRATCCTCPRRCRASRQARSPSSCSRPTA